MSPNSGSDRNIHEDTALNGTLLHHIDDDTPNPLHRFRPMFEWMQERDQTARFPYSRTTSSKIAPVISAHSLFGTRHEGVNFASQDYLNLATHPRVIAAAREAMETFGVHSAGSAALQGPTSASARLEKRIADFTGYSHCTLFPTGWAAGYGIIRTLVRPQDHVVIDLLAHGCLHEGAKAATSNIHVHPHLSISGVEQRLKRIRDKDKQNAIVVVTESLFSMDSDVPDLEALQRICRNHGAVLIVDCAHDLGAIGPTGRGYLELQGMMGKVDVLMGSFSKTFASNGGFVCCNEESLKHGIRYTCGPVLFSNTISPVNAALVQACFDIVDSREGEALRRQLMENILLMRSLLKEAGFQVSGRESAIIPVQLGSTAISRLITHETLSMGGLANLVEFPAVSKNDSRWRLQMMAQHQASHIRRFVRIASNARDQVLAAHDIPALAENA